VFLKVAGFLAFMLIVGRRAIPAALHWVAHTGSRELFRLAVLAIALGVAFGAAIVFDVSFALGAFFAGMILGETPLSRRATEETLPLRDAFAVLFFVSVGMLFDPNVVVDQPLPLLATVIIIVLGKSIAAFLIVRSFGHSVGKALTIAASLAQIGEFSFILAALGTQLGILPPEGRDLILAGAIISIFLNPFIFSFIFRRSDVEKVKDRPEQQAAVEEERMILIGYGRVGRLVANSLKEKGKTFVVIEDEVDLARQAESDGMRALQGNAVEPQVLKAAGITKAHVLLIAIPEGFEAGAIFVRARELNADIHVIARAHSDAEVEHLRRLGVSEVVMAEQETADRMFALSSNIRSIVAKAPAT
jgi:CPA2 family monovalent cation:H+ antiporter-2